MARHGKRVRIASGIYRDKGGISGVVKVRGVRREQRFPHGTTLTEVRSEMQQQRRALEAMAPQRGVPGTVAAHVDAYLQRLPEGAYKTGRQSLLAPWKAAVGEARFAVLTRAQLVAALMAWEAEGLSASTRNKRLSALRVMWQTIAPDDLPHACERVKRAPAPRPQRNRARPLELIRLVLDHVAPVYRKGGGAYSHAKLQLEALAWTGHGAATLARIRPEHARFSQTPPQVYLQPRRKGKGAAGSWISLTDAGAAALRAWLEAADYGRPWHPGVLKQAWMRAVAHTQAALRKEDRHQEAELLTGMRVYDLRHSFLTALGSQPGVDIYTVSEYAQHSDIRTTEIYMAGASSSRVAFGIAALNKVVPPTPDRPTQPARVVKFRR